jgi:hypothetical protein
MVPPEWARPRPSSARSSGPRRASGPTGSRGPNTGSQPRTATGPRTPTGQRPAPGPTGPRGRTGAPTGPRPYSPPPTQGRLPIPATLNSAAKAMYVGAGVAALGLLAGLGTLGSLRSTIEHQNPNASHAYVSSSLGTAVFSIIALGAVGAGMWLLMARLTRRGERRARTLSTMLFALATLIALNLSSRGEATALSGAFGALEWVTGLITIILLWSAPSRRYFDSLPPNGAGSPPSRSPSLRERAESQRNQSAQRDWPAQRR